MKLIIIGSGDLLIELINECKTNFHDIDLVGVCNLAFKNEIVKSTQSKLDIFSIKSFKLEKKVLMEADLVLSFNCSQILPNDIVNDIEIINMHVGVLPKYRGNSANTWAIMNAEEYVGFTIHKMVNMLDAGDIYYVAKIPIKKEQTYSNVYDELMSKIIKDTPKVLLDIYNGKLIAKKQSGEFQYCTMFSSEMGQIKNFDLKSEYYFNLFRCMARPHGSGIYFYRNNIMYEPRKVILGSDMGVCDYIGIPGKIVNIFDDMIWVKTHDNVILFGDIVDKNGIKIDVNNEFKNGFKLDTD